MLNYLYLPKYSDVYYPKQNQIIKLNKNEKILCAKFPSLGMSFGCYQVV